MTLLHVRLLGGFECRSATGDAITFPTRKVRALFAYLAVDGGQARRREKLAGLLWGDRAEAQARADLRKSLSRLRQALPEAAREGLVTDGEQVALRPALIELDLALLERSAADGTPETLERVAALYRGPLLEGLADCGEEFDAWLVTERRRVDEILQQTLKRLLDHYVVTGAIDRAIQIAFRLIAQDPLQESVHRALIRLYMYQDRVGAALDQYGRCRELLAEELGIEPSAETERLRAELLKLVPEHGAGGPDRESDDVPERPAVFSAAAADRARRRAELTARPSIVVLSFASNADEQTYRHLADGMAEDIATELGRFRELDVITPTTALAYRNAAVPLKRVGRELGTAYVLEGHLRPQGEEFRITVRLVETATARQLWAERYQSRGADIFDVQDDVVRRIVSTLVVQIEDAPRSGQAQAAGRSRGLRSMVARVGRAEASRPRGNRRGAPLLPAGHRRGPAFCPGLRRSGPGAPQRMGLLHLESLGISKAGGARSRA